MQSTSNGLGILLTAAILSASASAWSAESLPADHADEELYATVNGKAITRRDFQSEYANHVRNTFYHREGIAEDRLQAAREEVSDRLIDGILLREEVERRSIAADAQKVDDEIAGYEKRYAASAMWQQNRQRLLPGLRERITWQNRLERLEQAVRKQEPPTTGDIRKYYESHPELFTEPAKLRLHTILLKVDPAANTATWEAARAEAGRIVARLRAGADFGETARIHSHDRSAGNGGDMGYLHVGMVPEALQNRIDQLTIGVVGDPIDVLEGVGIFRLDERVPAEHRGFDAVIDRARDLLLREREKLAWRNFLAGLRKKADIRLLDRTNTAAR